jgi:hypothetical protein
MYAPTNEIIKRKKILFTETQAQICTKKSCETIKPFAVITMLGK